MNRDKRKYFFGGLLGVLIWFIIDGLLMYAGINASGLIVTALEALFG